MQRADEWLPEARGYACPVAKCVVDAADGEEHGLGQADGADGGAVGSGGVRAQSHGTADVSIMGSGDVEIGGGAKCNVSKMGSGDVRCS